MTMKILGKMSENIQMDVEKQLIGCFLCNEEFRRKFAIELDVFVSILNGRESAEK